MEIRLACEKTLKNRLKNDIVREIVGVEPISQFLRKQRLRWLGHLERMKTERDPSYPPSSRDNEQVR